ncbi:unnamed protein product [Soboliphyme baturini]|uniref:Uncharacterized protein n=1 Tax=Soboliphyme baturini TaxID=241478 RepID=A0A183JA48_9BILA|nr:unnamed protein product [Soboliphyme baturini]
MAPVEFADTTAEGNSNSHSQDPYQVAVANTVDESNAIIRRCRSTSSLCHLSDSLHIRSEFWRKM